MIIPNGLPVPDDVAPFLERFVMTSFDPRKEASEYVWDFSFGQEAPRVIKEKIIALAGAKADEIGGHIYVYKYERRSSNASPTAGNYIAFLFVARDEDEVRGRMTVLEVMSC